MKYTQTLCPQVIYVFRINDAEHEGCLKVGMTKLSGGHIDLSNTPANCSLLNDVANARIQEYTSTAAIPYDLLHTELTLFFNGSYISSFDDHQVHEVLLRSGIKQKQFSFTDKAKEWFITDLQTVRNAISAAKQGRTSLLADEKSNGKNPIVFRPEQRYAVDMSVKKFQTPGTQMLWNCKMRFGKTLSSLQVVREMNFQKTIIVTHRPVVDAGWFEDFDKIFWDKPEFRYGSRNNGESLESLVSAPGNFVYFASIQDLRGSAEVGGKFDKNDLIYKTQWDLVIVDEAHEGTQTQLGQKVLNALIKKKTCVINLSGTPFNIVSDYNEDQIINWTYVDEQKAKEEFAKEHPCDHNPYGGLPRMNMSIYDLGKIFDNPVYEAKSGNMEFNFREFFKTDKDGNSFVHEEDVQSFLDLMVKPDPETNYPFSTEEYRNIFRHTFWVVPGVKEAKALSALLKKHPVFSMFEIINVAGDGDDDSEYSEALDSVNTAIGDHPEDTYTITISCGRLTTGVSVKAWTAVFMLKGDAKTKAQGYMQTIFRVQTPAVIGGQRKEECYVFDFAPDRILTALDECIRANAYARGNKPGTQKAVITEEERADMDEFMKYCPVIAWDGSKMLPYDVTLMIEHLKRVQIERVVRNGFEDDSLYNNEFLMSLDDNAIKELEDVKGIIGTSKAQGKMGDFVVNDQGLIGEDSTPKSPKPDKPELSEEEKARKAEINKRKKQKQSAISILRGLSIRFPMLIYGANVKDETEGITLDNFTSFIDKDSWEEFMPQGISMQKFYSLRKYYDPDIFNACGKRIREKARHADSLPPLKRIQRIADIFSTFRNPDKETVLTPWRVVNMHLSDTIGGYDFFDEQHQLPIDEPRLVEHGKITWRIFEKDDPHVLEINSKSGLYPLYMAYSLFRVRLEQWGNAGLIENSKNPTTEEQIAVWDDVIGHNLCVLCKTPMAVAITKRTLVGFRNVDVHARYESDLIEKLSDEEKREELLKKLQQGKNYWKISKDNMIQFDAIVGNPPYQINVGVTKENYGVLIFQKFVQLAIKMNPNAVSMIIPSRWFTGGRGLEDFRHDMLNDDRINYIKDFVDSKDCFPTVDIAGGIGYFLWISSFHGLCRYVNVRNGKTTIAERKLNEYDVFTRHLEAIEIIKKIANQKEGSISSLVSPQTPFGFITTYRGEKSAFDGAIKLHTSGGITFVRQDQVTKNSHLINKYKIIFSKATCEHAGSPDKTGRYRVFSTMKILVPNEICTQSYLVCGAFDSEHEANNLLVYLKTKLVRFLILMTLSSQDLSSEKFIFVPVQDFSEPWTDEKLYAKYDISTEEQEFIESLIKPME